MKKYILGFAVLGLLIGMPLTTKAVTVDELMIKVNSLTNQVNSLSAQLSAQVLRTVTPVPVSTPTTTKTSVTTIPRTITTSTAPGTKTTSIIPGMTTTTTTPGKTTTTTTTSPTTPVKSVAPANTGVARACIPNVTAPWIQVLSPNGGETYTAGQQVNVKWKSCNMQSNIVVYLLGYSNQGGDGSNNSAFVLGENINANNGQRIVTIPLLSQWSHIDLPYFKIYVWDYGNGITGATVPQDYSDNFFTINQQTPASTCTLNAQLIPLPINQLMVGQLVVSKFKLTNTSASSNCNIDINGFGYDSDASIHNSSSFGLNNFKLFDADSNQQISSYGFNNIHLNMSALSSKTLVLKGLVTGNFVSGDSISWRLYSVAFGNNNQVNMTGLPLNYQTLTKN